MRAGNDKAAEGQTRAALDTADRQTNHTKSEPRSNSKNGSCRGMSAKFRAAHRYARTIPTKSDKRRSIRHLLRLLRAAITPRAAQLAGV